MYIIYIYIVIYILYKDHCSVSAIWKHEAAYLLKAKVDTHGSGSRRLVLHCRICNTCCGMYWYVGGG